jgi:uncharacterized phosphosugar-binding protein
MGHVNFKSFSRAVRFGTDAHKLKGKELSEVRRMQVDEEDNVNKACALVTKMILDDVRTIFGGTEADKPIPQNVYDRLKENQRILDNMRERHQKSKQIEHDDAVLREYRQAKQMSDEEIMNIVGCNPKELINIPRGKRGPNEEG